jgi:hypothetical protein
LENAALEPMIKTEMAEVGNILFIEEFYLLGYDAV